MKIEIEYNGAFAVCSIDPMDEPGRMVNFNEADTKSQTYALSAFRTIEEHWRREKQRGRQRIMEIAKREMKSGMLTYKDEEPVMVHAPIVEMMPSPRRGIVGWVKDRLFGVPKKPQAVMVLDRYSQELLKEYMKNPEPLNNAVAACAVSAEDIKEATDRVITLARGHHIRNTDGTITDVSDNPKYKCKK